MTKYRFGVLYTTDEPVEDIEAWLDGNCRGAWNVELEGLDDDLVKKHFRVVFEHETDKDAFSKMVAGGRSSVA